jgi:hypothetical protein
MASVYLLERMFLMTILSISETEIPFSSLGELCSGPVTDIMVQRARRKALEQGNAAAAEVRLQGIWTGTITIPVGLLMYVCPFILKTLKKTERSTCLSCMCDRSIS